MYLYGNIDVCIYLYMCIHKILFMKLYSCIPIPTITVSFLGSPKALKAVTLFPVKERVSSCRCETN